MVVENGGGGMSGPNVNDDVWIDRNAPFFAYYVMLALRRGADVTLAHIPGTPSPWMRESKKDESNTSAN